MTPDIHKIRQELLDDGPNYHIGVACGLALLDRLEKAEKRVLELEALLASKGKDKKSK